MKCPHKGYDLSTVTPRKIHIDGNEKNVIICPLHGFEFECKNMKLLN